MTLTTQEVFQGEDIHVSIHRKPFCLIEFDVKAGKKIINRARQEAVKEVNKKITLPGFRKGKAPEQTILKRYPQDVEQQFHKTFANLAYTEAQKLARVPLLNHNAQITFDLKSQSEENAELVFSFETEPVVPAVDPKLFTATPVSRPEVGEKQIDEAVQQMRFFFAEWTPIKERPIQNGDYIIINLDTVDEEGKPTRVFNEVRFEVSKERMAEWMQKLVQGAKWGDELEGLSEPDKTASEEEKKEFQPKKIHLSILKVEAAQLPELNDEFAKKVGAETVKEMRESIQKLLTSQSEEAAQEALRGQVNKFLTQHYQFDLPKSLIETEKEHRKQQWLSNPTHKKRWEEEMTPDEQAKFDQNLFEEANRAIRLFYLSRAIVRQANLPVTHLEVQQEAIATAQGWGQALKPDNIPKELFALALSKVILAKAEKYVLEQSSQPENPSAPADNS